MHKCKISPNLTIFHTDDIVSQIDSVNFDITIVFMLLLDRFKDCGNDNEFL